MDREPYSADDLLRDSTLEIFNLISEEGYQLPLDVIITDNSGRLFLSLEVKSLQDIRPTSDGWKLRTDAPQPILVTVTDRNGRVWKKSFGES